MQGFTDTRKAMCPFFWFFFPPMSEPDLFSVLSSEDEDSERPSNQDASSQDVSSQHEKASSASASSGETDREDSAGSTTAPAVPDSSSNVLPQRDTVHTVTELTHALKDTVESTFGDVTVEGELSNFKRAASGHCYFTIKDDDAQLRCVMWRYHTRHIYFTPEDGQQVRCTGEATVYPARGQLQLMATSMRQAGHGAQQAAYERLKRTLKAEGLFAADRKRPLPAFPSRVGVITSGDGAAIEDIRTVLARRYPLADVVLRPVPVQGIDAPQAIADAIGAFSALPAAHPQRPDVLIVGRGGGSAEDLWAFNDEQVARQLAACTIPTISAVGHETDTSITDFVADRQAATPSMAAEIAVPDQQALRSRIRTLHDRLRSPLAERLRRHRRTVERLRNARALHTPRYQLDQHRQHLDHVIERLTRSMAARVDRLRTRAETAQQRLQSANPRRPMQQGFALVTQNGTPVTSASDLNDDQPVVLRFQDGMRQARLVPDAPTQETPSQEASPQELPHRSAPDADPSAAG